MVTQRIKIMDKQAMKIMNKKDHSTTKCKVVLSRFAKRTMGRLPENIRDTIDAKIEALAADPTAANNNVKPLHGEPGFRLRIGDWRVLYEIDHQRRLVQVRSIRNRGEAYRK